MVATRGSAKGGVVCGNTERELNFPIPDALVRYRVDKQRECGQKCDHDHISTYQIELGQPLSPPQCYSNSIVWKNCGSHPFRNSRTFVESPATIRENNSSFPLLAFSICFCDCLVHFK